ncbi:MAG: phosphinothricin acetyltransferase, partial [Herminiimonas sp.]|nr:phosphinothricin acetyltransferase [Herminiimonas sp.]
MLAAKIRLASRRDASDLIGANLSNRDFHAPWVAPFTDQAGFDSWFNRALVGPNISLVAREVNSLEIVGVINIDEIVMGAFQSAYLGYYGTAQFARQGLMTD